MNKYIVAAGITTVLAGAGLAGASAVNAMNGANGDGLAEKLATTFNIDKTKVQETLDSYHSERHAEREAEMTAQRDAAFEQLVADGVLTQAQADALKEKREAQHNERKAERESMKNMTAEERKAKMDEKREQRDAKRAEMEAWAKEQGIDLAKVREALREHGVGPRHHGEHRVDVSDAELKEFGKELDAAAEQLDSEKQQ